MKSWKRDLAQKDFKKAERAAEETHGISDLVALSESAGETLL